MKKIPLELTVNSKPMGHFVKLSFLPNLRTKNKDGNE